MTMTHKAAVWIPVAPGFMALAGTSYYIAVDGFGGDVGDLKLNWNVNCLLTITNLPAGRRSSR